MSLISDEFQQSLLTLISCVFSFPKLSILSFIQLLMGWWFFFTTCVNFVFNCLLIFLIELWAFWTIALFPWPTCFCLSTTQTATTNNTFYLGSWNELGTGRLTWFWGWAGTVTSSGHLLAFPGPQSLSWNCVKQHLYCPNWTFVSES